MTIEILRAARIVWYDLTFFPRPRAAFPGRRATDQPFTAEVLSMSPNRILDVAGGFLLAAVIAGFASAAPLHEGDGLEEDAQPAYAGRGHAGRALAPDGAGRVLDMTSVGVTLLSWLTLQDLPGGSGRASDIWGYQSPSGREYALIGLEKGTAFVDLTDPVNPVIAGHIASPTSIWKEVTSYQDKAYVVTEAGGGMQVIDMSQIDQHIVTLVRTVTEDGLNRTHTIRVNEQTGHLYLNGCADSHNGGLTVFSAADPADPHFAGSWEDHYVHDAVITRYSSGPYAGREIAFACVGQDGLAIVDATDKNAMTTLSQITYPNVSYCHYGWLDGTKTYFYINDELDESAHAGLTTTTYVVDVRDLENPVYVTSFTNGNSAIDHNPIGAGTVLFEANYRSGLRIYDIADPWNAQEIGWFDTYPADDATQFNGAWGVHLLPSGTIIVSDIERGLFAFDASASASVGPWGSATTESARLLRPFPNPGRHQVNLGFDLPAAGFASLKLADASGRLVAVLAEGDFPLNRTRVVWSADTARRRIANGVYYLLLETPGGRQSERIVLAR